MSTLCEAILAIKESMHINHQHNETWSTDHNTIQVSFTPMKWEYKWIFTSRNNTAKNIKYWSGYSSTPTSWILQRFYTENHVKPNPRHVRKIKPEGYSFHKSSLSENPSKRKGVTLHPVSKMCRLCFIFNKSNRFMLKDFTIKETG